MCGIWGYVSNKEEDDDYFDMISHRGPDSSKLIKFTINGFNIALGFYRLAIIDLNGGNQPFKYIKPGKKIYLLCNGEIYNYKKLIKKYGLQTTSDCEVIIELYTMGHSIYKIVEELDGEFAFVLVEIENNDVRIYYARDRFGIRPLFCKHDTDGFMFSSELKGLPFGNGVQVEPRKVYYIDNDNAYTHTYYYIGNQFNLLTDPTFVVIKDTLFESVKDRMQSERPFGALLSGGLDSSLICGIAARILEDRNERLITFSIGMDKDSPDIEYARLVAKFINSVHHEIIIPVEVWLENLENVIRQIETYDITTVRASTGQYLISKWISDYTNVKVLLNGDGSDEVTGGYLYFYNAPTSEESHIENLKLLNQIHYYDVLRVDRGISAFGLESRVPFLCHNFVDTYLSINKDLRNPLKGERIEKYLLRKAFEDEKIIPDEVLWRKKEAFSDAVSHSRKSWFEYIQEFVEDKVTDEELSSENNRFPSKEAVFYYKIFKKYYPESPLEVTYWQPKWTTEHKGNPSARVLNSLYE